MLSKILSPLAILLTFSTATGIFVHDTHIDSAAAVMSMPSINPAYDAVNKLASFSDAHTHVERGTMAQAIIDLQSNNPRIQPRIIEDKKHLGHGRAARGHHAFD